MYISKFALLAFFTIFVGQVYSLPNPQHAVTRRAEDVSGDGRYIVEWVVDFDAGNIMFDVNVETTGFVGFGISTNGAMTGADIVVGGIHPNGAVYFSDRHGIGQSEPIIDVQQDWVLVSASENGTHTKLKFYRLLDTCDKEGDVKITPDTIRIIWAIGATDLIEYHSSNRGAVAANLLDPPAPPVDTSKFDKWSLITNTTMPSAETSYWCTMHTNPPYQEMRHLVGFNTRLDTPESLRHSHHLNVYKCIAPPGSDPAEMFGPFVGTEGNECYLPPVGGGIPIEHCRTMLYPWAIGGKPTFLPEHVGYPIIENGETEYLLLEMHYNNPDKLEGVQIPLEIEMFNTPILRENHAAVLFAAHSVTFSHVIPPGSPNFLTVSHCGPECTSRKLQPEGINLISVMLHSHLLGRKMKLRHFRGRTELPWVAVDSNYDFDYQQNRVLREEVKFLPGDQLTMECESDSSVPEGITIGGLSTHSEMCQAIIWYYPRGELRYCESAYEEWQIMQRFGIEDIKWDNILEPPIVLAPPQFANMSYLDVVDENTVWTPELIAEFQEEMRFNNHYESSCGLDPNPETLREPRAFSTGNEPKVTYVGYPEIDEPYVPEDKCAENRH